MYIPRGLLKEFHIACSRIGPVIKFSSRGAPHALGKPVTLTSRIVASALKSCCIAAFCRNVVEHLLHALHSTR